MSYNIDPIPNIRKKKREHYNGAYIIGIAFIAFIVIGLTVSLSIRSCLHDANYSQKQVQYAEPKYEHVETEYKEGSETSLPYMSTLSDVKIQSDR